MKCRECKQPEFAVAAYSAAAELKLAAFPLGVAREGVAAAAVAVVVVAVVVVVVAAVVVVVVAAAAVVGVHFLQHLYQGQNPFGRSETATQVLSDQVAYLHDPQMIILPLDSVLARGWWSRY